MPRDVVRRQGVEPVSAIGFAARRLSRSRAGVKSPPPFPTAHDQVGAMSSARFSWLRRERPDTSVFPKLWPEDRHRRHPARPHDAVGLNSGQPLFRPRMVLSCRVVTTCSSRRESARCRSHAAKRDADLTNILQRTADSSRASLRRCPPLQHGCYGRFQVMHGRLGPRSAETDPTIVDTSQVLQRACRVEDCCFWRYGRVCPLGQFVLWVKNRCSRKHILAEMLPDDRSCFSSARINEEEIDGRLRKVLGHAPQFRGISVSDRAICADKHEDVHLAAISQWIYRITSQVGYLGGGCERKQKWNEKTSGTGNANAAGESPGHESMPRR